MLGWNDIDEISNDIASDMTLAQCKAAVSLMLPLLKKTRTALKFTEGFVEITERRLQFNLQGAQFYKKYISQLLDQSKESCRNKVPLVH